MHAEDQNYMFKGLQKSEHNTYKVSQPGQQFQEEKHPFFFFFFNQSLTNTCIIGK